MDVRANGGPPQGPIEPWADEWKTTRDQVVFRTPESKALFQCKNNIQKEDRWDDFKKVTNPYEYIFLSWNRRTSRSVCTRQPLSRSYFKMIELWNMTGVEECLSRLVAQDGKMRTAHAAEGPGGFIEACWKKAADLNWSVSHSFAITLRSDAKNIPGWRKAAKFLADRPGIYISEGADGTGNILHSENQDFYILNVMNTYPTGVHLYTADGGFDFSSDYNAQEDVIFPLLLAESLLGLQVLAKGGCLFIKCFDTTERPTLDLLWLLSRCFREWSLFKPHTSRAGNAERYFVGIGFLGAVGDIVELLKHIQTTKMWNQPLLSWPEADPNYKEWLAQVFEFQEKVEQQEYVTIQTTLDLIHTFDYNRVRTFIRDNIHRSIAWCEKYGEDISNIWFEDREKNIGKEAQELLQILAPERYPLNSYHSWYMRMASTVSTTLTFEGFRTSTGTTILDRSNPFMRYGASFRTGSGTPTLPL